MDPAQYCAERAAAPGSTLYYATLFLPPEKRGAVLALHALALELDETVRECSEPGVGRVRLEWWREEIGRVFAGEPRHPVARALRAARQRWDLPAGALLAIFEAGERELHEPGHADFAALRAHCQRGAGTVAALSAEVCGYADPGTRGFARHAGEAARLADILRTLREDARRGRVHLPRDELARFGVDRDAIAAGRRSDALGALLAHQAERTLALIDAAEAMLPAADRHAQHPALIALRIHRVLVRAVGRAGPHALARRHGVTPVRKLWIAWRTERATRPR